MEFYNDFNLFNYRREREKYSHFLKILTPQTILVILFILMNFVDEISPETGMLLSITSSFVTYLGTVAAYVWCRWKENLEIISVAEVPLQ